MSRPTERVTLIATVITRRPLSAAQRAVLMELKNGAELYEGPFGVRFPALRRGDIRPHRRLSRHTLNTLLTRELIQGKRGLHGWTWYRLTPGAYALFAPAGQA